MTSSLGEFETEPAPSDSYLDPILYQETFGILMRCCLLPGNQPLLGSESGFLEDLFLEENIPDAEVGRQRETKLIANGVECRVKIIILNEAGTLRGPEEVVRQFDKHAATYGFLMGYMHIMTDSRGTGNIGLPGEPPSDGGIQGMILFYERPVSKYDFSFGTASATTPATQEALVKFVNYLGINESLLINDNDEQNLQWGTFDNDELLSLSQGLDRLAETDMDTIEV